MGDSSWEIAVARDTQDERALEVEQCECPPGYTGTSCEDCAEGYERSGQGPYLGYCVPARRPPPPAPSPCDQVGALTAMPQYDGRCECKQNVVGEEGEGEGGEGAGTENLGEGKSTKRILWGSADYPVTEEFADQRQNSGQLDK